MAAQGPVKAGQDFDKAYEAIEGDFQEVSLKNVFLTTGI